MILLFEVRHSTSTSAFVETMLCGLDIDDAS